MALLGWVAGCAVVWSGLFTVGSYLYGRMTMALFLLGVFIVSSSVLVYVINQLWANTSGDAVALPNKNVNK